MPYLERFEGMKVRFPQSLVIAEYFNYGRFGEMVLALPLDGETRPFTGTAVDEPGARGQRAHPREQPPPDHARRQPERPEPAGPPASERAGLLAHEQVPWRRPVQNTVGVLGFDFSLYRIFPTGPADYSATNERPDAPEPVGGTLRVAAMNTLNFFLTLDDDGQRHRARALRRQRKPRLPRRGRQRGSAQ